MDVVGSAALVTQSERSGVSLHVSVEYLRPALSGDDVLIDAKVSAFVVAEHHQVRVICPSANNFALSIE